MAERTFRGGWIAIPRTGRRASALRLFAAGTGKALSATIVAGNLRLDVYRLELAAVVSKYVDETEKNLQQLFSPAESSQAVLFFDEADELFGPRAGVDEMDIATLSRRMALHGGAAVLPAGADIALAGILLRYRISLKSASRRLTGTATVRSR